MAAEVVVQLNWVRVYCQYNQTSTEPHKPPTTTRIQLTMHNPNAGVVDGPLVDGTTTVEPWVELIGGSGRTRAPRRPLRVSSARLDFADRF